MINLKFIIVLLLFGSSILFTIGITSSNRKDVKTVEYKFIPRSFKEEQDNPVPLMDIYYSLFNKPSPWISNFTGSKGGSNFTEEGTEAGPIWSHNRYEDDEI